MISHNKALNWAYPGRVFQLIGEDATVDGALTWLSWEEGQPDASEVAQKISEYEQYVSSTERIEVLGYTMKCAANDAALFSSLVTLLYVQEQVGRLEFISFYDANGTKHTVSSEQFKKIAAEYGRIVYERLLA